MIPALFLHAQDRTVLDEVVAVVGSEILMKSEVEKQFIQYRSEGGNLEDGMDCRVVEDLLFSKLLLNQAKLDSVEVSEQQVDKELDRRVKYFISQIGSQRALEEYYKKPLEEIENELRPTLKEQMIIQQMQGTITDGLDVTPSEVRKYYNNIPADSLPFVNATVEVAQIVVIALPGRQQTDEARNKLNQLRERIIKGDDFATLAVLYSEDPGTSTKGGELGFVGRAEVDPAFADAAFKLKGNEVSRIVTSVFGYHIIQLIDKEGEKINVRHILIKPKIEGKDILRAGEVCDSIRTAIRGSDTVTFAMAAQRHSDDEASRNNGGLIVNPQSGSTTFELDELDPSVYIAIEKLAKGDISESKAYATRDGKKGYSLYYLLNRTESHKADLKLDYQIIQEAALNGKRTEVMNSWIGKKLESTYSRVFGEYQNCNFVNQWNKAN